MPYTINGIGTRYYGAGNRSAHVGTCNVCKRSATLSSYDTREFFCILYIPIIPLTKFRILDDCSSCRRHHRMKAKDFHANLEGKVQPLRDAINRSPRDPQPYIDLVQTYVGWQMRAEAQRELDAALSLFPQNAELLGMAGDLAVDMAAFEVALPHYQKAHTIDPNNKRITYAYAWLLHQMEQHEKAIPALQEAISQDSNKVGALYLLGISAMKLMRWNDALHAFQQVLSLEPKYTADKQLLRLMRDCKLKLGYELNDAERRAGRRWWPFGGGTKQKKRARLQGQPVLVRPGLKYAGIAILAFGLIGGGIYQWDKKTSMKVYFDNALDRTVSVDVDGRRFDLGRNAMHAEEFKEGQHKVVVREKSGKEIEHTTFGLEELSIFDSMMHDRFFVYNVASQRVYRRAVHGYAVNRDNATYSESLIGMRQFFDQQDVDFPFEAAPDTIEMDANSSVKTKISFNPANEITLSRYALIRLREGKPAEAKAAIDRAVAFFPCDTPTRRTQVFVAATTQSSEVASQIAHKWISDCSQDDLEAHRMYQDVNMDLGKNAELRDEYRKLVAAAPSSGKLHYLYGRTLGDPASAVPEYQKAVDLEPAMVWPRVALGHAYSMLERGGDALHEYESALGMPGCDQSVVTYYATSAVANGMAEKAIDRVDTERKAHPKSYSALDARWLLAVATEDWSTAADMQRRLAEMEGPESEWWRNMRILRMKNDPQLDTKIDGAMRSAALRGLALNARIEHLLETGEYSKAADLVSHAKDLDPTSAAILQAYAAGGLMMQGDASASKSLDAAEKLIAGSPRKRDVRIADTLIAGLRGTMSTESMMEFARENEALPHAWLVIGVRNAVAKDKARAADAFARASRAASDLEFPYLAAKSMQASLTTTQVASAATSR